jgi:multiple sugar transport system permease protein
MSTPSLWNGSREKRNFLAAMAFLLPNFLGFLTFTTFPVLLSLYMSFTNWTLKAGRPLEWVGLRNYEDIFSSGAFWFYLYNTVFFMLAIPVGVMGSLFLANALAGSMRIKSSGKRWKLATAFAVLGLFTVGFLVLVGNLDAALLCTVAYLGGFFGILFGSVTYRTMFYIPSFASGVATVILWTAIYKSDGGLANNIISSFLPAGTNLPTWLSSTENLLGFLPLPELFANGGFGLGAREAIMFMGVWMGIGGNNMILYIAAISGISDSLYEAADIDGAGSFSKFWHITVPSVAPTTFFIAIMAVIGGLQGGFMQAKIMTGGGPAETTTTLAYDIYTTGFEELELGAASAVAWVLFTIVFGCTLLNWKYGNKKVESAI